MLVKHTSGVLHVRLSRVVSEVWSRPGYGFPSHLFHSPLTLPSDNIAPPVAACLGDLVTLSLLGVIAELHLHVLDTPVPIIIVILLFLVFDMGLEFDRPRRLLD